MRLVIPRYAPLKLDPIRDLSNPNKLWVSELDCKTRGHFSVRSSSKERVAYCY